jgi:hypothetical protein
MNGKELKLFGLTDKTEGSVSIRAGDLQSGMYLYALIIDGKVFDTKKMVLTAQ